MRGSWSFIIHLLKANACPSIHIIQFNECAGSYSTVMVIYPTQTRLHSQHQPIRIYLMRPGTDVAANLVPEEEIESIKGH